MDACVVEVDEPVVQLGLDAEDLRGVVPVRPELRRRGVRVVLAGVGDSTMPVDELTSVYETGQFAQLQRPYNQVVGVAAANLHTEPLPGSMSTSWRRCLLSIAPRVGKLT